MSLIKVNMTYEPYSKEPEYIEANREFLREIDLEPLGRVLDLACGTGTITDLLLESTGKIDIIGVDLSRESLLIAQEHFQQAGIIKGADQSRTGKSSDEKKARLCFVHGTADVLPLGDASVDAVFMCNSIHMLPDENKLLTEINRVLRPGGILAFNSSFYAGTFPEGTEKFHHEWVKQAIMYLVRKDAELKKNGKPGLQRKRGTAKAAFSKRWPSKEDWGALLEGNGFKVKSVNERTVIMTQRSFETIGAYAGLATVLLSGYAAAEASEALQEATSLALKEVDMEVVPRYWLEMTAVKE